MDKRDKKKQPCRDMRIDAKRTLADAPDRVYIAWCNCCGSWEITQGGKAWKRGRL